MRYKNTAGFTLLELLIATSLLSMTIFIGSYAYSLFSTAWTKRLGDFDMAANQLRNLYLLRQVVSSTAPFIVTKEKKSIIYFYGEHDKFRGVSYNGIFADDKPVIFQFSLQHGQLLYSESDYQPELLNASDTMITFEKSISLLPDCDQVTFKYFGWKNLDAKQAITTDENQYQRNKEWSDTYSGEVRRLLPEFITLQCQNNNEQGISLTFELINSPEIMFSKNEATGV